MSEKDAFTTLVDDIAGQRLELVFHDQTFTTPLVDDWMVEFLENAEFGRIFHAIAGALGPDEYERWKATKPKMSELQGFINQITSKLEAAGKG